MTTRITHWTNGSATTGRSGRSGPVFNPATGEQTGEVDFASRDELDRVVRSATEAAAICRATSLARRTGVLFIGHRPLEPIAAREPLMADSGIGGRQGGDLAHDLR